MNYDDKIQKIDAFCVSDWFLQIILKCDSILAGQFIQYSVQCESTRVETSPVALRRKTIMLTH